MSANYGSGPHNAETLRAVGSRAEFDQLCEMIARNEADDAIDMLRSMTGTYLRSVAEQRNLFPERIP